MIVKVTREVEKGVLKCHRYWPDPTSEPPQKMVLIGQIEVEHMSTITKDTYVVRKFKLQKGGDQLIVQQFSYEVWPDHGVPVTTREFLDFRDAVKTASDSTKAPVVIHCSAGVGRTGTYMTVDRVLDAVEAGIKSKDLDIDFTVASARKARVFMVQTEIQYQFCFKALLDGIRINLEKLGGAKAAVDAQTTQEDKDFVKANLAQAAAEAKAEDEQIADLTAAGSGAAAVAAGDAEISAAEAGWKENKGGEESYDIKKSLNTIESRVESLFQAGKEIDMSKARPEQIQVLVDAAKRLTLQKKADQRRQKSMVMEREKRIAQAQAEQVVVEKKQEVKSAAQKKANKFLAKQMGRK